LHVQDAGKLIHEYGKYSSGGGVFAREMVRDSAKAMPPHEWWQMFCSTECPLLTKLAMKMLSQSASASSCEQNWSHFDFIHSPRRNRLTITRATKLVWLFSNLRLSKRTQALDQEDLTLAWDDPEPEAEHTDVE